MKMRNKIQNNNKILEIIKLAVEHVSNGVTISDPQQPDNPLIYVNKGFEQITGYTKKEVIGKNCRFLQGNEKNQPELKKIRTAIKNKKETYAILRNYKKNGELFWNELYISPIFDENGKLTNFIGIQNDITKRKKAEETLEEYKQYLEKTIQERTKDLKDANLQLQKEVLERQKAQEKISDLYERISASAKKLEIKLQKAEEHKLPLTKNEKATFLALLEKPEETLKETSTRTGLPVSTINAAKTRLKQEGYYKTENLPNPQLLGKLITITYYENPLNPENTIPKKQIQEAYNSSEIIYAKHAARGGFYATITEDWTQFKAIQDKIAQAGISSNNYKTFQSVHFPLKRTLIRQYFNYAPTLQTILNIKKETKTNTPQKITIKKINEAEKKVLYGMTKYPDYNNEMLSAKIDVSEPTISKYKNKILKEGTIIPSNKPTYEKISGNLLAIRHIHFNAEENFETKTLLDNTFLELITTTDIISFALYPDYQELQEDEQNTANLKRTIIGEPKTTVLPTESIQQSKLDFTGALKKILFK